MPLSNAVMNQELQTAFQIAMKALAKNADCAGLFGLTGENGNSSPAAAVVLANLESSFNNFASLSSRTDAKGHT